MLSCAEQNFNQDFQSLNETLTNVHNADLTENMQLISDNRILFKKLKKLLKQDYFMLQFFNNEIIYGQIFEAFKTLINVDKKFSIMKDIIKLLVLTVSQVFDEDWKVSESVGCKIWLQSTYEQFLAQCHAKLCTYLTKYRPSKSDITFLVINFDMVSHLIKLVDFRLLIKNNFVMDQIQEMTIYWKYYPDKFFLILSQTLQNFYIFHFASQFNGCVLIELLTLILNGYSILINFFHSATTYRSLCVRELSKLSSVAQKFATMSIHKHLNIINLKIFDLLVSLLITEVNTGTKDCSKCIDFLDECLESTNQFVKTNWMTLEDEYKTGYLKILKILIELIDKCNDQENSLLGLNQSNASFEIIKNLIKSEKIDAKFFYSDCWPEISAMVLKRKKFYQCQDFIFFIKYFFKMYPYFEEIALLDEMINFCRLVLNDSIFVLEMADCLILMLKLLEKFEMEKIFEKKFSILLELYEIGSRKLEIKKWFKSIDLYLEILDSRSKDKYFLRSENFWTPYLKKVMDSLVQRKFDYQNIDLVQNYISSILKLVDLIFTYFNGRLIENYYVNGILNFFEFIFDKFFRNVSSENDCNLAFYNQKLSLTFMIEKIKNL